MQFGKRSQSAMRRRRLGSIDIEHSKTFSQLVPRRSVLVPAGPCALRKHRVRQCNGAAGRRLGSVRASASDVDSSARLPQGKCNAFAGARLEPVTTATRSEVIVDRDRVSNALPIDWQFLPLVAPPSSKSNRGCRPLRFSREHRTSCRDPSHKPLHPGQP